MEQRRGRLRTRIALSATKTVGALDFMVMVNLEVCVGYVAAHHSMAIKVVGNFAY
jgi:hypothetical protein